MKKNTNPTKACIKCGSKNVKMIHEGLETDQYKCKDCKEKWLVTDFRIMLGFTKKQCKEMDKEMSKRK